MEERKVTIPAAELLKVFEAMLEQTEGIREACRLMAEEGIAEKTEGVEVVNDIATALTEEMGDLIEQFSNPENSGEVHIFPLEPRQGYLH